MSGASVRTATALTLAAALALTCTTPATAGTATPGAPGAGDQLLPGLGNGGYQAEEYTVDFRFEPGQTTMAARTVMSARGTQDLSRFNLDFAGGVVHEVLVDGRPAAFRTEGEELVVTPARPLRAGQAFTTDIRYTTDRATKLPSPVDETSGWGNLTDGGFALWAQPDRAHLFFPVNDHPSDKARFTYRVNAPQGWTVVGNGLRTAERTTRGRTETTYRTAHPITTQVVQLAVGKFALVTGTGPNGLPLRSAVPAAKVEQTRAALARIPGHLAWLETKIGRPFPLEAFGALGVDGHVPQQTFALENPTLASYPVRLLENPDEADETMVHEAAHQWFGNSVSFASYRDVWLSEGFASYFGLLWNAEQGGESVAEALRTMYQRDQQIRDLAGSPVVSPRPDGIFGLARSGGALAVYFLRQSTDLPTFQRVLGTMLDRHRDATVSTAQFERLVTEVGGAKLGAEMSNWLHAAKTPKMPGHPDW
ncbi:aminopeptidase N [Crossiella equi]|uniref:Aminopeptidase N n=1 Tax=Crossiella equi TaxID=130796 RepID=A0ABS5AP78_9PSEU|nr:M1 family metallopeptidase [Crossiella equi]MBP2478379.1 aminopeptidase N [Crossiella equi]